jgi:predicted RNase H-like HicB family nuclease
MMRTGPVDLEYWLAVPYVVRLESVETPTGEWVRVASHPELAGCQVVSSASEEAIERLEIARREWITDAIAAGRPVPVPRPPLPWRLALPAPKEDQ